MPPTSNFPGVQPVTYLRILLPDAVVLAYDRMAVALNRPLEEVLADQLKAFQAIPVGERVVVIPGAQREAIETALKRDVQTAGDLVTAVEDLTTLAIGGIKLQLSRSDQEEIKRRAEKNGISPREELARSFEQIKGLIIHGVRS